MSKSSFNIYSWLPKQASQLSEDREDYSLQRSLADFRQAPQQTQNSINKFFVPGWRGESLVSKEVKGFIETLKAIHADVRSKFRSISFLNSKLREGIYEEFLDYAEFKALNFTGIDSSAAFFKELQDKDSSHQEELSHFLDIYTFRTSTIYALKIRFIAIFLKETSIEFDEKNIFYPNAFLTRIFRKGSSSELNSEALKQNIYSWYKPSIELKSQLHRFYQQGCDLSITEIIKNISILSEEKLKHQAEYSHSISHKSYGLFLNSLLINFPLWLKKYQPRFRNSYKLERTDLEIISSKYQGDYLESISLSHWLAQDANKYIQWHQILCPSFNSSSFDKGLFTKITNELQFLSFLTQLAGKQNKETIPFLCEVMKGHLENRKQSELSQHNLFNDILINKSRYDRLVINLNHYPKSNVQHFVMNQVSKGAESLKDNGLIFLLSSKKLFIPSQKDKLEAFLKKFKLEGLFDFTDLQGKGEVGDFIYIFSKRNKYQESENKNSFLNFRISGELKFFCEFESVINLTHDFFANSLKDIPSILSKNLNNINFEFFQDVIIDGQMIHSSSQDSNKITHPRFFKNITNRCITFNKIFEVTPVKDELNQFGQDSLLRSENAGKRVLVVDQRTRDFTNIEIIDRKMLASKIDQYGKSLCHFFYIEGKFPFISYETLNAYFESQIGKQVIDLTFNNQLNRVKANLQKLLVPLFLVEHKSVPVHIASGLNSLSLSKEQILEYHPTQLAQKIEEIKPLLCDLVKDYPEAIISNLYNFQKNIKYCLGLFESKASKSYNFNNPLLKTPLILAPTSAIYPNNPDVYIDFDNCANSSDLHLPLSQAKFQTKIVDDVKTYQLELWSDDKKVISLFSDKLMIYFLEFLLSHANGVSISQILQGIKIPSLENFKEIIDSYDQLNRALSTIRPELEIFCDRLFNISINKS